MPQHSLLNQNSLDYLTALFQNDSLRNSLYVPDLSRKVFSTATKDDLKLIINELGYLHKDIMGELRGNIEKRIIA